MSDFYSINDLARMTGLTTRTLRNYINAGTLSGEKDEGVWRFSGRDLEIFFANSGVQRAVRAAQKAILYDYLLDERKKTAQMRNGARSGKKCPISVEIGRILFLKCNAVFLFVARDLAKTQFMNQRKAGAVFGLDLRDEGTVGVQFAQAREKSGEDFRRVAFSVMLVGKGVAERDYIGIYGQRNLADQGIVFAQCDGELTGMNAVERVIRAAGNQLFERIAVAELSALILIRARIVSIIEQLVQILCAEVS